MEPKFKKGDYIRNKTPKYNDPPYDLQGKITGIGRSTTDNRVLYYYVDYKGTFVIPIENQDEYELVNR